MPKKGQKSQSLVSSIKESLAYYVAVSSIGNTDDSIRADQPPSNESLRVDKQPSTSSSEHVEPICGKSQYTVLPPRTVQSPGAGQLPRKQGESPLGNQSTGGSQSPQTNSGIAEGQTPGKYSGSPAKQAALSHSVLPADNQMPSAQNQPQINQHQPPVNQSPQTPRGPLVDQSSPQVLSGIAASNSPHNVSASQAAQYNQPPASQYSGSVPSYTGHQSTGPLFGPQGTQYTQTPLQVGSIYLVLTCKSWRNN